MAKIVIPLHYTLFKSKPCFSSDMIGTLVVLYVNMTQNLLRNTEQFC